MPKTLRGAVLAYENGRVVGWAFDPENASLPVELEICFGKEVILRTQANMHALPLAEKGIGSGNHAFSIKLPESFIRDEWKAALLVRTKEGGIILPYIPDWDMSLKSPPLLAREIEASSNVAYFPAANTNRASEPEMAAQEKADLSHKEKYAPSFRVEEEQDETPAEAAADASDVKVIAFYLPQFHPIPENNEWWGKGFTEWTNVTKAVPYFEGHDQPQLPGELGYYDLRLSEIREEQARLARAHGIYGFCYYYYWFNGRRILERPLEEVFASGKPDLPFCICWANENWTRTWDGADNHILLAQKHDEESDAAFIRDVLPMFHDPRYITVDGAPLLIIYRPEILPNPSKTLRIWRKICKEEGFDSVHIAMAQSFGAEDPREYGFDSAVQFPPHGIQAEQINSKVAGLHPGFTGKIYDYQEAVDYEICRGVPDYRLFRTAMPGWDNTPRKNLAGNIFHGTTPEKFKSWLSGIIEYTREHLPENQRFVFINAWNEWAEGAHLEPDRKNGSAYLQVVRQCLENKQDWKDIIARLTSREKLPKQKRIALAKELEKSLRGQERSLAYYTRLYKLYEGGGFFRRAQNLNSFVEGMPESVVSLPIMPSGILTMERIQHHDFLQTRNITVSRRYPIFLCGWSLAYGRRQNSEHSPLLLILQEAGTLKGRRYHCPIAKRVHRNDVVEAFKDMNIDYTAWSGFRDTIDFAHVAPGRYAIGAIHIQSHAALTSFAEGTVTVTE